MHARHLPTFLTSNLVPFALIYSYNLFVFYVLLACRATGMGSTIAMEVCAHESRCLSWPDGGLGRREDTGHKHQKPSTRYRHPEQAWCSIRFLQGSTEHPHGMFSVTQVDWVAGMTSMRCRVIELTCDTLRRLPMEFFKNVLFTASGQVPGSVTLMTPNFTAHQGLQTD